jgi:hypothetical protein
MILDQQVTERSTKKNEITAQSFCITRTTASRSYRGVPSLLLSFKPWIERSPHASGELPITGTHGPTPKVAVIVAPIFITVLHNFIFLQIRRLAILFLSAEASILCCT